jgi:ABC-type branched-subunit amino acid transport system substrate-binding protein
MGITNLRETIPNTSKMAVKYGGLWLLAVLSLAACSVVQTPPVLRIALLAPFEGRYREVGYDLLYSARLALVDGGYTNIELLPIDEGGSIETAELRARAIAADERVRVALVAGYPATHQATQIAFADVPLIVIGNWDAQPARSGVFILANKAPPTTAPSRIDIIQAAQYPAPVIGGAVFALKQFPLLRADLTGVTIVSSAALPDAQFTERYLASDLFVPEPGLLVTIAYDATHIAAQSVLQADTRSVLAAVNYSGLNGIIRFDSSGFWKDAPLITYGYDDSKHLIRLEAQP